MERNLAIYGPGTQRKRMPEWIGVSLGLELVLLEQLKQMEQLAPLAPGPGPGWAPRLARDYFPGPEKGQEQMTLWLHQGLGLELEQR